MGCVYTQPRPTTQPYVQTAQADSLAARNDSLDIAIIKEDTTAINNDGVEPTRQELLMLQADKWAGTPHKWGGTSASGIDCSALVQNIFAASFDVALPRTTREQVRIGEKVSTRELQIGDLVFYRINRRTRHVGIYVGNNTFLHASKSEGVAITSLEEPYWRSRFWMARRILPQEEGLIDKDRPHKKVQITW